MAHDDGRERVEAAAYGVVLLLVGLFFATFLNRFAGLRSGNGEFSGGVAWLRGQMPYRDYYTAGPPLNGMKSALLLWVFGKHLLVSRVAGAVERMVLAWVLLGLLRQVAGLRAAATGALVAVVLSAGDRTDPVASYNHDAILWAMLAGLCASMAIGRAGRGRYGLAAVAGLCASLSLLTKQTVGAGAALVVLGAPAVCLLRRQRGMVGVMQAVRWAAAVMAGLMPALAVVGAVLWRFGLLREALAMLFVRGPAAKAGRPGDFFVRMGLVAWDNVGWVVLGVFWLVLAWPAVLRALRGGRQEERAAAARWVGWLAVAGVGVLVAAEVLRGLPALHDSTKAVVYAMQLGLVLVGLGLGRRWWRGCGDEQERLWAERMLLLTAMGLAVAFFLGLSWPAFEAMLLPGAGLLVAMAVEGASGRRLTWTYAVLVFLCLMQVREKLDLPFGFDLQDEGAVRVANEGAALPMMEGMRLPAATVGFLRETTGTIQTHTRPGEPVLTFPEMDLVYTMSGRLPPTVAHSHNMDVVNDAMARAEAERLRRTPPVVLVYYRETEADLRGAERLWRRGGRSGQREMIAAIEGLLPRYRKAGEYVLREGDPPIGVYVLAGH